LQPAVTSSKVANPEVTSDEIAARDTSLADALDDYERRMIQSAIDSARGNIAEAARRLQTDRPNLYRRMKRLGIGAQTADAALAEEAQ